MSPLWRRRFLTWGILIAVFGMRIVFPVAIVAVAAGIGPISAVKLAVSRPADYAQIIEEAHLSISAFGGTFLMMVALSYFFDQDKSVDWVRFLECRLRRWASMRGVEIAVVLSVVLGVSLALNGPDAQTFLFAAICGLLAFLAVELLGRVLDSVDQTRNEMRAGGLGAFLYLEVLDASFSFDGVIGAFALTRNLFLIAIGLGIGAVYVRGLTIMLVERGTLSRFRYLEHGAFYSVLALSLVMFAQSMIPVPEIFSGGVSAGLIALALWSSLRHDRASIAQR